MRSRLAAGIALAALLAAPAAVFASTPSPSPLVRVLSGTLPLHLNGARDLGPAPAGNQQVVLVLALRDQAGLDRLLADQQRPTSPDYRRWLMPAEFAARFAPSAAAVTRAKAWATTSGLTVSDVSSNRTLVTLEGTRAALDRAFAVRLHAFDLAGKTYVTPDRTATLPTALASSTASVLGLTTYNPNTTPHRTVTRSGYQSYGLAEYGPHDFETIYHAPPATTGARQSVAVITDGELGGVARDLRSFQERYQLPRVPLTVVQAGNPTSDTAGAEEYALDTQYSTGFAPGVKRLLAYNGSRLGDIHPLNQFVEDRRALTASASYGGCEFINELVGFVTAGDQVFKQAMAQGQTFWVSSGDEGSACAILINTGTPAGIPDVEYPASSRYVVSVGGTSLTGQTTQPLREITWLGGGGGYSNFETAQPWQQSAGTFVNAKGRGVPDISLDADPNSGFVIIFDGKPVTIGGTSASAPAWNGIWARVLQRHPRIGFAAPAPYRQGPTHGLVDITLGTNGLYAATPGYDLSTGLGTPDISRLVSELR